MNIFSMLGKPEDFRPTSKVTQLVKHYDEVIDANKEGMLFGVQEKEDGVCCLLVVSNQNTNDLFHNIEFFTRTSKRMSNMDELRSKVRRLNLEDGVYMGEVVCDGVSLEVLSGVTSPNRVNPLTEENYLVPDIMRIRLFDLVSIPDFLSGTSAYPYISRFRLLKVRVPQSNGVADVSHIRCKQVRNSLHILSMLDEAVSAGGEGIVIINMDAGWLAGHKNWRKMKLVRGVSYDLTCIGYEEGKGKLKGKVANVLLKWKDGKTIKASLGKGWTYDMAEDMFNAVRACEAGSKDPHVKSLSCIGKIFEVTALEESSKGKLRLPKAGQIRFDKVEADV